MDHSSNSRRTNFQQAPWAFSRPTPSKLTHFFIRADLTAELVVLGDVVIGGGELTAAAGALEARAVHQTALDQLTLGQEHRQLAHRARLALADGCGDVLRPETEAVISGVAARW